MNELNTDQQRAATHIEGPLLVLAGAGSGKTRVVTFRVAHLLSLGVLPSEILAVTFTNKAAHEMQKRIFHLTHQAILACTFHSLCARILRESISALGFSKDFVIYDADESEKVLKGLPERFESSRRKRSAETISAEISHAEERPSFSLKSRSKTPSA